MQPMPKGSLMARAKVAIEQQQPTKASSGKQHWKATAASNSGRQAAASSSLHQPGTDSHHQSLYILVVELLNATMPSGQCQHHCTRHHQPQHKDGRC